MLRTIIPSMAHQPCFSDGLLEDEEGAQFEEDSSGDFDIWSYEEEMQVYALSEDRLVLATTEDALDEVLDLISGKDRKSSSR